MQAAATNASHDRRNHGGSGLADVSSHEKPAFPFKATIKDVAAACGLSPATVSNAVSGARPVNAETRQRVLETVHRLGYSASTIARGLRMQRSWSVGFLIGDITNPYFPEVVRGAECALASKGYNLVLGNTDYHVEKQRAHLERFMDAHVDGLIVCSQSVLSAELRAMSSGGFPVVFINEYSESFGADYIGVDLDQGMMEACTHIWNLGHRRIAFIAGRACSEGAGDRQGSFLKTIRHFDPTYDEGQIVRGDFTYASGVEGARHLLSLSQRPTAVIAANDLCALGVIDAAETMGFNVPGDLSVLGIDDIPPASFPRVGLSTISIPKWELGLTAATMVLERIASPDRMQRRLKLIPHFIRRNTTAPPAS